MGESVVGLAKKLIYSFSINLYISILENGSSSSLLVGPCDSLLLPYQGTHTPLLPSQHTSPLIDDWKRVTRLSSPIFWDRRVSNRNKWADYLAFQYSQHVVALCPRTKCFKYKYGQYIHVGIATDIPHWNRQYFQSKHDSWKITHPRLLNQRSSKYYRDKLLEDVRSVLGVLQHMYGVRSTWHADQAR